MQKDIEKAMFTNSIAHSNNILGKIVKYSHDKHMYNTAK